LAGGAAGYYMEKQKQISDDRARIGSYGTDVDRSTVEINRSVAYAKSAQSCYQSQFKALLDGRKNKSINEAEGRKRLAEIVSGLQETNALLVAANGRAGENISNYTQAYEKDLQQVGVPRAEVTKVAEAENRASTTKGGSKPKTGSNPKVPKEAVATEQTIRKAQDAQSEGNKVASQGQGMIREVCNSPDMGDWAPPSCAKA
ncbi:type VI secretion-associated lipoprotein TagQ, partial [Pseudomonas aeruginosa]